MPHIAHGSGEPRSHHFAKMRILLFSCFAFTIFTAVQAQLRCWECDTKPTNEECIMTGRMTACLTNQNMCQNEVRVTEEGGFEISKRCKQSHACDNNVGQNDQSAQCSFLRVPKAICRCCCGSNFCNRPFLECHQDPPEPPPVCRLIGIPRFGRRDCTPLSSADRRTRTAALNVECRFTCREGYILLGNEASTCTRSRFQRNRAVFDRSLPRCASVVCDPPRTAPANGAVSCTDGNSLRSVCTYTCQNGFSLVGSSSTRCGLNNRWSFPPPTCESIRCIPPHVNPRRGQVMCSDRNFLGSVCRFECDQGFLLEGSDISECLDDGNGDEFGRWSSRPPTCTRIRCNPPQEDPENGNVDCTDGNEEGSVCSFTCNDGFFLAGNPETVCQDDNDNDDDGVWSSLPPSCTRITCNPPQTAPVNGGVVCTNQNFFGSNCRFSCDSGFFLSGARNTRCDDDEDGDADGVWSQNPPTCIRITCSPMQTNPVNGDVTCSNSNNLGSICRFACQEGFAVDGARMVRCRDDNDGDNDGVWSDDPPTCAPVSCNPPHVDPDNGDVDCTNGNNFASVCSFTCDDGFFLRGSPRSVCEDDQDGDTDGVWSSLAPTCVRIRCRPPHSDPTNGEVMCTNGNNEGSVCSFRCNEGYFLEGEEESTCLDDGDGDADGVWSAPAPRCRRVLCNPPHVDPRNGDVTCTNGNNEGSLCTFTCNRNFFLMGFSTSLCEDDLDGDEEGLWNNPAPVCIQVTCVPPRSDPANGDVMCSNGNNAGSNCRYSCDQGFFLDTSVGAARTTCRDDEDDDEFGEWTNPPPSCGRIICNPPHTDPANGRVRCSDANNYDSTCEFECDGGFFLSGSDSSTCEEDDVVGDPFGAWSSPAPTCIRIACRPPHVDPVNGDVDCTASNFLGSVCTFTCDDGFFLSGNPESTCNDDEDNDADGVWSSPAPTCGRIRCRPPFSDPNNGEVLCSDSNFVGSECSFRCDEGFFLEGAEVSVCQDDDGQDGDGVWSERAPVCARILCVPEREDPENGNVDCTDRNRENSVCTYTCNAGYFLDGSDRTVCEDDNDGDELGLWSEEPPVCLRVFCEPPHVAPANGDVDCTDGNNEGSECSFTCDNGFFLDGSDISVCNDDRDGDQLGVWSAPAPVCVQITCPPPHQDPDNGAVDCTNSNLFNSLCTFSCNNGFFLDGSEESRCLDDGDGDAEGVWDNLAPVCVQVICTPPHVDPDNGGVDCTDGNNVFSICSFECDAGFFLNGSPASECLDDLDGDAAGEWDQPAPTCEQITCIPPHTDPTNGNVDCTMGNLFASTCTFVCNDGFFLNGAPQSTCLDDDGLDAVGEWSTEAPICSRILCIPEREDPENGQVDCTDRNNEDSVCTYTCNAGYFLDGSDQTVCEDDNDGDNLGLWSEEPPVCLRVFCEPPHVAPANGDVDCTDGNNEGSECSFTCDNGFFLDGSEISVCNDDRDGDQLGVWSAPAPVCVPITCLPPHQDPDNGAVDCTNSNFFSSLCTFTCDNGFFLDGSEESRCIDDNDDDAEGVWDNPAPVCVQITCNPPHVDPLNGGVDCTAGNRIFSVCTFECNAGFFLNGETTSQCLDDNDNDADGVWDSNAPICEQITCIPPHVDPTNGNVDCTNGNLFGSSCQFECDDGFFLNGASSVSNCVDLDQNDALGDWDAVAPTCSRIVCVPPHVNPENGNVGCTNGNNEDSICAFECDEGFFLIGEVASTCVDDNDNDQFGEWTSEAPICTQITCLPMQVNPDNGEVSCTNGNLAGSICTFTCDNRFFREGQRETECIPNLETNSGAWSNAPPICIQITCEPPFTELLNGDIDCSDGNNVASRCQFTCDRGFALVGSPDSVCNDDFDGDALGEWTDPLPTCQRIVCLPPYTEIMNGQVDCTDFNFVDSVCTFTCNSEDFELIGEPMTFCLEAEPIGVEGIWTFPPPTCERRTCGPPPDAPENGAITCTDGSFLGSECEYSCEDFHTRVGPLITVCIEGPSGDLIWTNEAPICSPNVCEPQEIENGNVDCSTESLIASTVCEFVCNENFDVLPPDLSMNTCLNNSQWSTEPPCCAQRCPPFAFIDLVVIMDASTTVDEANWEMMRFLVSNITELFQLGPDMTQIGVFHYNRAVVTSRQIFLNEYTSNELTRFQRDITTLPYREQNNGTVTGAALTHARNVFFRRANGDRPDALNVILLITDGRSQDAVSVPAQLLRDDGTLIYVVGVLPPTGTINQDELIDIAGDPERVIIAVEGFDSLDDQFAALLGDELCPAPCQ